MRPESVMVVERSEAGMRERSSFSARCFAMTSRRCRWQSADDSFDGDFDGGEEVGGGGGETLDCGAAGVVAASSEEKIRFPGVFCGVREEIISSAVSSLFRGERSTSSSDTMCLHPSTHFLRQRNLVSSLAVDWSSKMTCSSREAFSDVTPPLSSASAPLPPFPAAMDAKAGLPSDDDGAPPSHRSSAALGLALTLSIASNTSSSPESILLDSSSIAHARLGCSSIMALSFTFISFSSFGMSK
mmetsp:Transcript_4379/g.9453  ORF Transcript_4379/g.9453 Transcript_4379/m.9453 type:complete len:243 (-) Transcript_4379:599-1327(-)